MHKCLKSKGGSKKSQRISKKKNALETSTLPGKLADCSEKDAENCEVYIVEGDSAGGSANREEIENFKLFYLYGVKCLMLKSKSRQNIWK